MPKVKLPSGRVVKKKYTKKGKMAAKNLAKKTGGKLIDEQMKGGY